MMSCEAGRTELYDTYRDVEEVARSFQKQLLVRCTKCQWLHDVARTAIPLEHSVVDHVPEIYNSHEHHPLSMFVRTHQKSAS